jgi:hypothetical protein
MKLIPLREFPGLKTAEIIKTVIERPAQGATVASMRTGVRLLDALEKNADAERLLLEDADHAALIAAINSFTFGMVSKDLLTIVDDVINAKAPPPQQEAAA